MTTDVHSYIPLRFAMVLIFYSTYLYTYGSNFNFWLKDEGLEKCITSSGTRVLRFQSRNDNIDVITCLRFYKIYFSFL